MLGDRLLLGELLIRPVVELTPFLRSISGIILKPDTTPQIGSCAAYEGCVAHANGDSQCVAILYHRAYVGRYQANLPDLLENLILHGIYRLHLDANALHVSPPLLHPSNGFQGVHSLIVLLEDHGEELAGVH